VQRDGFERFVFIDLEGELVKRSVTVGTREAGFTEIRQGIGLSDRVVINPASDSGTEDRG
jgi:hypothetical protein